MTYGRAAYLGAVISAGAAAIVWALGVLAHAPPAPLLIVLLALTGAAASFPLRMPGFPLSFSLAETFTLTSVLLFGVSAGVIGAAVDGAVISLRLTRENRSVTRVLFNTAAPALAMWIAGRLVPLVGVFGQVGGGNVGGWRFVGALAVFTAIYFVANTTLVAGAVAHGRGSSWFGVWRAHFAPLWVSACVGALAADLIAVIAAGSDAVASTVVVVLPFGIALILAFSRVLVRLQQRSASFAQLRTFAAALRSTEDAVLICDNDGRITYVNPAGERLTGWSRGEAEGRHLDDVRRLQPMSSAADERDGEHPIAEYRLVRRDGGVVDIEETHTVIRDEDDAAVGTITTFRDIGGRKALDRAKDEFLSTLSHELRTPTTAIVGWAQLLKSGRLDAARTTKAVAALERNARAQAAVLNDLVDVSRIVRGTLTLDLRRTEVGAAIAEALETVRPAREGKGIAIDVSVPDDLPDIDADPQRLRQVLWNVLSNAVKFTPAGGVVRVAVSADAATLRIVVSDTGVGIDPQFLPFVFDRFRQGDQSSQRHYGGLGLGLAIVRYVVEAHGGTVAVRSGGNDQGTTVIIELPAARRPAPGDGG